MIVGSSNRHLFTIRIQYSIKNSIVKIWVCAALWSIGVLGKIIVLTSWWRTKYLVSIIWEIIIFYTPIKVDFFLHELTICQKFVLPYSTKYTTRDFKLKLFYSLLRKSLVIFTDNKLLLFYFFNSTNIKDKLHKLLATTLWSITCKKQGIAVFNIFLEYKNTHIVFLYFILCLYQWGSIPGTYL